MVLFFTATLGISIVGMISLLLLKRYELNTGRIFMASSRPAIGGFFHRKLMWFEYVLPGLLRVIARRLYRALRRIIHVWAAWIVVKVEYFLEHALHRVRHTTVPQKRGQTSAFLRQVVEHKKKLQEDLPERGTVIEE
jgi:hypothetical protein